jgi:hypothetical protein
VKGRFTWLFYSDKHDPDVPQVRSGSLADAATSSLRT